MSTILLAKIEEAFEKISKLSENEKEVEINELKLTLGILTGLEDDQVQAYLAQKMEEFGPESFMKEAKIETVAYAIKAIGEHRIDQIDFFSYTDKAIGKEQKVERHIYLRQKLKEWPSFISTYLFNQYALLLDDLSKTLKPELRVEGVEEIIKQEAAANMALLNEASVRLKATREAQEDEVSEDKAQKEQTQEQEEPMSFRRIEPESDGGTLDQAGA